MPARNTAVHAYQSGLRVEPSSVAASSVPEADAEADSSALRSVRLRERFREADVRPPDGRSADRRDRPRDDREPRVPVEDEAEDDEDRVELDDEDRVEPDDEDRVEPDDEDRVEPDDVEDRPEEDADRDDDDDDPAVEAFDDAAVPPPDPDDDRPLPVEPDDREAVCQRFPPALDGRVIPAVGRPSSRFET
ncbi:hypothetical protein [Halopelagius longus]|uniref:hypothetical protein n=1 Tax=Halopelagius longus TaxID=1236180 RepID=UPI001FDEC306|nr:hypothetical protein [Halopelagius longus]